METSVLVALIALGASFITAMFTFVASRRSGDDSHAISLINAGQNALQMALERTTLEVIDSRKQGSEFRIELGLVRAELAEVRTELDRALELHSECERMRVMDSREIARLKAIVEGEAS